MNRTERPATYLEMGTRSADERGHYPDSDLKAWKASGKWSFSRKDGSAL